MLTLMFIVITIAILFVMSRDNRSNSKQQQQEGIMHSITSSKVRWTMWLIVAAAWISYNVVTLPYIMSNGNQLSSMRLLAEMIQMIIGAGVFIVGYINLMMHFMAWHDERRHTPRVPLYAKMYRWVKHVLPILVVILVTVGCDADHGVRMKALTDAGYPSHCQRDINKDGWHTLEEGASVIYKDLGPCPTCREYGVVPVYTSNTDTTWSTESQWKKQTLEALELELIQFPYHICDMDKEEWDDYRMMKWDYESSIWWRGTLLGLEKMSHMEVQATEECTSRRPVKESTVFPIFLFSIMVISLSRKITFSSRGYELTRPAGFPNGGEDQVTEVSIIGDLQKKPHGYVVKCVGFKHTEEIPAEWIHVAIQQVDSQQDMEKHAAQFSNWNNPSIGDADHCVDCYDTLDEAITFTGALMRTWTFGDAVTLTHNLINIDELRVKSSKGFIPTADSSTAFRTLGEIEALRSKIADTLQAKTDLPEYLLSK